MNDAGDKWLDTALELATRAGHVMRKWGSGDREVVFKTDRSPLTAADVEINQMVLDTVEATYPGHRVLGEEVSSVAGDGPLWVCDPIDGTIPFSIGVGTSTFSLAVVEEGVPQVAVCADPWSNIVWSAVRGQGCRRNGQVVTVCDAGVLADAYVGVTGTPNMFELHVGAQIVAGLMPLCRKVMMVGSVVAEAARVADGGFGGSVFMNDSVVDVAAAALLVEEAGGLVTDLWGDRQRYDQATRGMIASNGKLHDDLLAAVAAFV